MRFHAERPIVTLSHEQSDVRAARCGRLSHVSSSDHANFKAIEERLTKQHGFALSRDDLAGIEYVYRNFHSFGLSITYSSSSRGGGFGGFVSYAELMVATDESRRLWSFLANEDNFTIVKLSSFARKLHNLWLSSVAAMSSA